MCPDLDEKRSGIEATRQDHMHSSGGSAVVCGTRRKARVISEYGTVR